MMRSGYTRRAVLRALASWLLLLPGIILSAQDGTPGNGSSPQPRPNVCLRRGIPLTLWKTPNNADLIASDLQVTVDGKAVSVVSLSKENLSPRVVLLVDTSGSMGADSSSTWGNTLLAVAFALETLPPHSPVALVTFNEQAEVSGFGDPEQIRQKLLALKQTKPHGRTALYDAIQTAMQLFGAPQFGDLVYVISDGGNNVGRAEPRTVANELIRRGIRVFAFVVETAPGAPPPPPREREASVDFIAFIKSTGGSWIQAQITPTWSKGKEAAQDREWLRAQLESPYALEFQLASSPAKPVKLRIATSARGFELSYPQHVEPCVP